MSGPLEGIRIVELASMLAGAGAGYMLGDLGAEVIKIEDPVRGDLARGTQTLYDSQQFLPSGIHILFETGNRNKKGIILDLKNQKGREVLYRLVEKSDVFYTSYSEGVRSRLGADYETLSRYNPRLIYGIMSGYGRRGPDKDKRAFDVSGQARSGIMWTQGDRDLDEPSILSGAPIDQSGATMMAYGILTALVAKERTGQGQIVESSMLAAAINIQAYTLNNYLWRGRPFPRFSRTRSGNPLTNMYKCADDKWLYIGELEWDLYWDRFCQVVAPHLLEDPRLDNPAKRREKENRMEIIRELDKAFATRARQEWMELLQEKGGGISFDPINEVPDVADDPQVLANEYIVNVDHEIVGPMKVVGTPIRLSKTPVGPRSGAPAWGQHTEEVLVEVCGYTWDEIVQMRNEGAMGSV